MEYLPLIQKYFSPTKQAEAYRIYLIHVTLVTNKALQIAQQFEFTPAELRFLEEASMLHDIGIFRVDAVDIDCHGELPYIQHVIEGGKILREEGFPEHALVAETHTGVGILADEIREKNLPLPEKDLLPSSQIAEIISWADLFFSKNPDRLWQEKSWTEVQQEIGRYGTWHSDRLELLREKYML